MSSIQPIAFADLTHRRASHTSVLLAASFMIGLVAVTIISSQANHIHPPELHAFVPIAATLWGVADLLSAYLLFNQFSVNGIRAYLVLGAAFAVSGVLTIPYIFYFPGLFSDAPLPAGVEQISAWMWVSWHLTFPIIVGIYHLTDRNLDRRVLDGDLVRRMLGATLCAGAFFTIAYVASLAIARGSVPMLVNHGRFTALFAHVLSPLIFAANVAAAAIIVLVGRKLTSLQIWLAVALLTAALDGVLNAWSFGRYSFPWYVGKIETLTSASVVLAVLLSEVGGLYRRLGTMAMIDLLTGLRNRRTFDEYVAWTLDLGRRAPAEISFIMVDIDFFKAYNDTYGHAAGDACLKNVADRLAMVVGRSVDLVARYGGEEFVALLPGTTAAGARSVAERIRQGVIDLDIPHERSSVGKVVSVSVGVTHAAEGTNPTAASLYDFADRALYRAKKDRNTAVFCEHSETLPSAEFPLQAAPAH